MPPIRILLVDDHFMVRLGLRNSLDQEPDLQIVGEAASASEAIKAWKKLKPTVTLMDGQLPDRHGVRATLEILGIDSDAKVIILSVDETEEDIHTALSSGAKSYLPKTISRDELLQAVRIVADGETYLPQLVKDLLAERASRPELTSRELEVLRLISQGLANKQIAKLLSLAEITVKVHVSRILGKLGASDRTHATTIAIERGIVKL